MKTLRFLLISPTSPLWRVNNNQRSNKTRVFRFSMLPCLYVAASMPPYVETTIIDEDVNSIDFNADVDLVGISFMTYNAPRAYEIADRFKARKKKVIFGGYHPTFMPEEAIQHADAICIGEAEKNVPEMIRDFMNGNLKSFYENELIDLRELPKLNRGLLQNNAYITTDVIQATRGCFHRCEFCSIAPFNQYTIRTRPVGQVIDELKSLGKDVLFMDDNITLDREYAKELFAAIIPLKKRWYSQCGIGIAEDDELLDLAVKSGCRGLFIGFESISQQSLGSWKKQCNKRKDYLELVKKLHKAGVAVFAGFVFGSDEDDHDVFADTLDFLLDSNMDALQSTRLTPFPGTPLFEKLMNEGRIFDKDWSHYDFFHVVHQPRNMSPEILNAGTAWVQKNFYSPKNIFRRMGKAMSYLDLHVLLRIIVPLNLSYRYKLSAYGAFEEGSEFKP